ncbi:uncharacterized protein LOC123540412 [Mercenaria mercenaria]|uniref:uncharacterized protein LOC123540412 n=1 Tax=Mercenaria mercenaria TaxID=6596 RepID=UPI00234E682E|nr:uncharacterized protein LOC123540412 [Mercenaria mercenaria]
MKIILLFAACSFVVNGRTHENGQNKRDLILKALTNIGSQDMHFPEQMVVRPESQWFENGLNGKIEQIQIVLGILMENLEAFKEEDGNDEEQTGGLHTAINNLYGEILNLNITLTDATRSQVLLQNPLWKIVNKLDQIHGDEFTNNFWNALFASGDMMEEPVTAEEDETTGNEYTNPSPSQKLSQMTKTLKNITALARIIVGEGKVSKSLLDAILTALDVISPETTTTTTVWTTTWDFGSETATNPPTTEEQDTTLEPTHSPQTTPEPTESAQTTPKTTESQQTTSQPTSSTESSVVRRENLLKRRLIDLLLKKMTASKRENNPPY